jgi:hypothetical protein
VGLDHRGRQVAADRLRLVDFVISALVWLAVLELQRAEHLLRRKDVTVAVLAGLMIATAWLAGPAGLAVSAAANAVLLAWNFRHAWRRKHPVSTAGR